MTSLGHHTLIKQLVRPDNPSISQDAVGYSFGAQHNCNHDEDLILEDTPPLEFESPVHSPLSANAEEHEKNRNKSLPPRKCDRIPIYIFLGPNERDPPFPKAPIECKNNLAYIHLGPEDSSTTLLHRMSLSHANVMQHTFTWIQKMHPHEEYTFDSEFV